jgi:hypothetical protein
MLFTIGTSYFIFVNTANNQVTQAFVNRGNTLAGRLQENIAITTGISPPPQNKIEFFFNNTGAQAVNVTALILLSSSGAVLECDGVGLPAGNGCINTTPALPAFANPGKGAPSANFYVTSYGYMSGVVTLKLFTSSGGIFTQTYPQQAVSLAAQALTGGAIGDIYMFFNSFSYYQVYSGGGCPSSGGGNSGYCLSYQADAFTIADTYFTSNAVGFSVRVADLDPSRANITLDKYSSLVETWPGPSSEDCFHGQCIRANDWYILTNSTTTIKSAFVPITLFYNKPVTLVFASYTAGNFAPNTFAEGNAPSSGTLVAIDLFCHGWRAVQYNQIGTTTQNYGQNSPYFTTLFS